jgi:hypothetical protein
MHKVKAKRITNEQAQKQFLHAPDITGVIHHRKLKWTRETARVDEKKAQLRLITSSCKKNRQVETQRTHQQNSCREVIAKVIPGLPQDGQLHPWIPIARDKRAWNAAIARLWLMVTHNTLLNGKNDGRGTWNNSMFSTQRNGHQTCPAFLQTCLKIVFGDEPIM